MAEVPAVADPQPRSPLAVVARNPPGRTVKPPLDIFPIFVWSPSAQSAKIPSRAFEGEERKHLGHERDEDSLFGNAELAARPYRPSYWILTLKRGILCPLRKL